jgi:hypothetical protein
MAVASITGFTYNEINIIAYYIVLPFIYVFLIDRILRKHILKIAYAVGWIVVLLCIHSFREFSDQLFKGSVYFLQSFGAIGLDYVAASVVICVILPGVALVVLLYLAYPALRPKFMSKQSSSSETLNHIPKA